MLVSAYLPKLNKIAVEDPLWSNYTKMVSEVIVPYQWEILNDRIPDAEPTHCLDNFKIAAGMMQGEHKGVVFMDTDVYKWLESVAYCIHNGQGKRFEQIADEVIELLEKAQCGDGYLNTYYTVAEPESRWSNLIEGHELYSAGHLIEAAVAYYEATGKKKLLNIACRFADLIFDIFGPGEKQIKGYPGHQEIELALVKLYDCTGNKKYLDTAQYFIESRGESPNYFEQEMKKRNGDTIFPEFISYQLEYSQSHLPVRKQKTAEGHAVRAMYMYCAMADLAYEFEDKEMLEVCTELWKNVTEKRMYITGGIGSSGFFERFTNDYHLPNASGYCETCASIGLALYGRRMALMEQDASYYDTVERALYNTVLAGISIEGDRYFYVNPLEVKPEECMEATSMGHVKAQRQRWFSVACCPTNVARTLASLGQYIYAQNNALIFINLFISSTYDTVVYGYKTNITMKSTFLQDGKIKCLIKSESNEELTLKVRIPDYVKEPKFTLNGSLVNPMIEKGYAVFKGNFNGQHELEIQYDVKPRWVASNINVKENIGKVALMKGPCVFCLEEIDNGKNLASCYADIHAPIIEELDDDLIKSTPILNFEGGRMVHSVQKDNQLYGEPKFEFEKANFRVVPYALWGNRKPGEMQVWIKTMMKI